MEPFNSSLPPLLHPVRLPLDLSDYGDDLRIQLGTDVMCCEKMIISYVKSMGKGGNHLSMPHLLAPIVGIQSGVEPTDYDHAKATSAL